MVNEFRSLEASLNKVEEEIKHHEETDRFVCVMREFHTQAYGEFKRLFLLRNKMNEWYDKVVRYYGEDPAKMHPDEFFGIFKRFTSSWEVIFSYFIIGPYSINIFIIALCCWC